jgi:hypothetical protein
MSRLAEPATPAARYRAARHLRITPLRELPPTLAARLPSIGAASDCAALLVPRRGPTAARALTPAAADLFRSLARPRQLAPAEAGGADSIARFVLDGILEIEHAGGFVSGPAAHGCYFDGAPPKADSRLARLSQEAVRHAASLGLGGGVLQRRLYQYNTAPITPAWRRRLGTSHDAAHFLRSVDRPPPGLVHRTGPAWHYWRRARRMKPSSTPTLKLYVSPGLERLPDALHATLALLREADARVAAVKVGADLPGLLRSDKLVAYFTDLDALDHAAALLSTRLGGMPPQGVPFTADLSGDGLISSAVDPPADVVSLDWTGDASWRAWVAGRLASSLTLANAQPASVPSWVYAIDRLSLDGVDACSWTGSRAAWAAQAD